MTKPSEVLLSLAIVGSGLIACGTSPDDRVAVQTLDVEVDSKLLGRSQGPPRTSLRSLGPSFVGTVRAAAPKLLEGSWVLEYTPIVIDESASTSVRLSLVVEREKTLLSQDPAVPKAEVTNSPESFANLIRNTVEVEVSPYEGDQVWFEWQAMPPDAEIHLAGLRLERRAKPRPDVLLICSDTHRYDHSFGDDGFYTMPNLQRLANENVAFPRAYSTASWTLPSITSALTGLYPRFHGVGKRSSIEKKGADFEVGKGHIPFPIRDKVYVLAAYPESLQSLPEMLRAEGYRTALITSQTFYALSGLGRDGNDVFIDYLIARGSTMNRAAAELVRRAPKSDPLFLQVHYLDTHEWHTWYTNADKDDPADHSDSEEYPRYARAARSVDRNLATLLDVWEKERRGDAIVVFWSDHGEHLGDLNIIDEEIDGVVPGYYPKTKEAFGHGVSMEDVLLHVPLVLRLPTGVKASSSWNGRDVSIADITPTVLDAAGVTFDEESFQGRSLLRPAPPVRRLTADFQLYVGESSVLLTPDYKLILEFDRGRKRVQLRDKRGGAYEPNAPVEEAVTTQLVEDFASYVKAAAESQPAKSQASVDRLDAMRALRSLGYIE